MAVASSLNLLVRSRAGALFYTLCLLVLCTGIISSCGPSSTQPDPTKVEDTDTDTGSKSAEEELDDLDDTGSSGKTKTAARPAKPRLSTEGKKTGEMVDGYEFAQQNEFLGLTNLKVSKVGIRLESPNLTCIMLPGKEAIAYNAQNGNCMQLTAKSAAMLAGKRPNEAPSVEETKTVGKDKIAGLNCTHYVITKYFIQEVPVDPVAYSDPKNANNPAAHKMKKEKVYGWETDIWATKDIQVPASIVKDCARMTQMPPGLGFPVRIQRDLRSKTQKEQAATEDQSKLKPVGMRSQVKRVIDTSSYKKSKLDKGDFVPLDGFKTVKDEMQLMMSGDDSELEGMGLEEDMDKPAK